MRHRWWAVLVLALGCQGELIDNRFPGIGQPPTPFTPALAFRIGGAGPDLITAMVTDPAGGVILAGTFTGSTDFDPGAGVTALTSLGAIDGFLARYSSSGALAWALRFGSTGDERVTALARDASGSLYVGGGFEGAASFGLSGSGVVQNSDGGEDGFVAKFSPEGVLLWARRFGGAGLDEVTALAVDGPGNVFAAGVFNGTANPFPAGGTNVQSNGASDGFVLALDPGGSVRWTLPIGGPQADAARGLAVSSSGRLMVAGTFRGAADFDRNGGVATSLRALGGVDFFLAVYSSTGLLERVRAVGGLNNESLVVSGLSLDGQDGAVLLGSFSGSLDFDPGPGLAARTSQSGQDVLLARYDAGGEFLSVATVGGLGTVTAARAIVAADGSVVLTGAFSGPIDFDPGAGINVITSLGTQGVTDAFAARYTAAGGLAWVGRFGESTAIAGRATSGTALGFDSAGNPIVVGHFFGSPDFDPGPTAFRLISVGEADGFVVKLTPTGALAQ